MKQVAAIRLRAHYIDPYEEWEKETRKDALVSQIIDVFLQQLNLYTEKLHDKSFWTDNSNCRRPRSSRKGWWLRNTHNTPGKSTWTLIKHRTKCRQALLEQQANLTNALKERTKKLWQKIEASIKVEEERAAARREMERKAKAEEERKQKEAELKKRLAEEKLLQEETARKKAAEEKRLAKKIRNVKSRKN